MASKEAKARRRAEALNELDRLSALVADKMGVEVPNLRPTNLRPTNRDPELAQIERVEAVNGLLSGVLTASGVEVAEPTEDTPEGESEAETAGEVESPKVSKRRSKGRK
jgi:hypothetical protein